LNKKIKYVFAISVLALMAFSIVSSMANASGLPWTNGSLVTSNQLTIAGSSTVGPIAQEEISDGFVSYWNSLVATNYASWCTLPAGFTQAQAEAQLDLTQINLATLGSGTAIPALAGSTADIGEMSRPPQPAEYSNAAMPNMQLYAVGIDSAAIVVSPDMTWFPKDLTTLQVAELFADNSPQSNTVANGTAGATTPLFSTWGAFFTNQSISTAGMPPAALTETIQRAVRDPTSGTFDCFNNYFVVPNGLQFEAKQGSPSYVYASENMAPYKFCEQNQDIYNAVSQGSLANNNDYIGFISLGYLQRLGNMIGINIAYNMAPLPYNPTSGATQPTATAVITYYGPSGTWGSDAPATSPLYVVSSSNSAAYTIYQWGSYVTPTRDNVVYAYSGYKDTAATGQYEAWRWLWEVVPGTIPSSGTLLATGVWIAYMREWNTTTTGNVAEPMGTKGPSNFVNDQYYILMSPDDMAGGPVLNSNLATQTPLAGQTQSFPTGKVTFTDLTYFVSAYIAYYNQGKYNPYADLNADGKINFSDLELFVQYYIAYYSTYVP
jgi:ABC-type phosphate transport system substrate-binding protein